MVFKRKNSYLLILCILALLVVAAIVQFYWQNQNPKSHTDSTEQVSKLETANWESYNGKYFSFKYPVQWENQSLGARQGYSRDVLEGVNLRISPRSVLDVTARNSDYEKAISNANDGPSDRDNTIPKVEKTEIDSREAIRLDYASSKTTPYPTTEFLIKGIGKVAYYLIYLNGDRNEISETVITQFTSSLRFLDK